MTFPLTKALSPADYTELASELAIVDQYFTRARPQHEHRKWEYCMTLRAVTEWDTHADIGPVWTYDVGGAGSPFIHMIESHTGHDSSWPGRPGPPMIIAPALSPPASPALRWTIAH